MLLDIVRNHEVSPFKYNYNFRGYSEGMGPQNTFEYLFHGWHWKPIMLCNLSNNPTLSETSHSSCWCHVGQACYIQNFFYAALYKFSIGYCNMILLDDSLTLQAFNTRQRWPSLHLSLSEWEPSCPEVTGYLVALSFIEKITAHCKCELHLQGFRSLPCRAGQNIAQVPFAWDSVAVVHTLPGRSNRLQRSERFKNRDANGIMPCSVPWLDTEVFQL